jgi:hypothetical protein
MQHGGLRRLDVLGVETYKRFRKRISTAVRLLLWRQAELGKGGAQRIALEQHGALKPESVQTKQERIVELARNNPGKAIYTFAAPSTRISLFQ